MASLELLSELRTAGEQSIGQEMPGVNNAIPSSCNAYWLFIPEANSHAKLRLLCFPYAGGRSSVFAGWQKWLPSDIELCCVQFPGRDAKCLDTPYMRFDQLMTALLPAMQEACDLPMAFFGHSMGALISFELARALRSRNWPTPVELFLSSHRAPHQSDSERPMQGLPDEQFVRELHRRYGATPDFLQSHELMEMFLPLLRADFAVCETYQFRAEAPLDCAFCLLGGLGDRRVRREHLTAWQMHTRGPFQLFMFPGDHFYIKDAESCLAPILTRRLSSVLSTL